MAIARKYHRTDQELQAIEAAIRYDKPPVGG